MNTRPITRPATGTYEWFIGEIGQYNKDIGGNPDLLNHSQAEGLDRLLQRGYRRFLRVPGAGTVPPRYVGHRWSFMYPSATLTLNGAYTTGTVTLSAVGVVTLTGGVFPSWSASGEFVIQGVSYTVNTRDSDTQITLDDITHTAITTATSYSIQQIEYDLPSDFGAFSSDAVFTYQRGASYAYQSINNVASDRMRQANQFITTSGVPVRYSLQPKAFTAGTGQRWVVQFLPAPDDSYVLNYRYQVLESDIGAAEYPLGGPEHYNTILWAALAEMNPGQYEEGYKQRLSSSIQTDTTQKYQGSPGTNYDTSGRRSLSSRDGNQVSYSGTLYD